jgi:hypothetical protein
MHQYKIDIKYSHTIDIKPYPFDMKEIEVMSKNYMSFSNVGFSDVGFCDVFKTLKVENNMI